jgi:putative endonuclease
MSESLSILNDSNARETLVEFGSRGEALAADLLRSNGYRIVLANFKVPIGRNRQDAQVTGEIDIIALDGETLCFIEVKTRRSEAFAPVITAVDLRKQRQITRTAKVYRRLFGIAEVPYRYDVVTVLIEADREPRLDLIKGFWNESKFRKRVWHGPAWQDF